jgi:hypothetical protein
MEKWSMDKEEYFRLKKQGIKDTAIAKSNHVSTRTLDRWKAREGITFNIYRGGGYIK